MSHYASSARAVSVSHPFPPRPFDKAEDGKRELVRLCADADTEIDSLECEIVRMATEQAKAEDKAAQLQAECTQLKETLIATTEHLADCARDISSAIYRLNFTGHERESAEARVRLAEEMCERARGVSA